MNKNIIVIASIMLFAGAAPLSYGYYTILRIVACGVFITASFASHTRGSRTLPWIFALLAVVFNPIIPVHFPKEVWALIDIGSAIFLLLTRKSILSSTKENQSYEVR